VLEWAFHTAPQYAYVAGTDNGLIHYCLGRPGRLFDQIGPVVAGHDDIATALLNAALAAAGSHPVVVDAFDAQPAFSARLQSRGFVVQRPLIRMCRPAPSAAGERSSERRTPVCGTADMPRPQGREFAILGPEFA
jgi:hypothetical protein